MSQNMSQTENENMNTEKAPLESEAPLTMEGDEGKSPLTIKGDEQKPPLAIESDEQGAPLTMEGDESEPLLTMEGDEPEVSLGIQSDESYDSIAENIETSANKSKKIARRLFKTVVAVLVLAVVFCCGLFIGKNGLTSKTGQYGQVASNVTEAAKYLDAQAITEIDVNDVTDQLLSTLVDNMDDKWAQYYTKDEYSSFEITLSGNYSGIGVVLSQYGNYVVVVGVYDDSPADEAGVKEGDIFYQIDGSDGSDSEEGHWTSDEVANTVRRAEGEEVDIVWIRPSESELNALIDSSDEGDETYEVKGEKRQTTITCKNVEIPNIDYELLDDEIGYISLSSFTLEAGNEVENALFDLMEEDAKGIILDLRNNGGGYLTSAVSIVSLFLKDGVVTQLEGKTLANSQTYNVLGNRICDLPLVVLVNGESASASEITASALQDNDRATIVGVTTYGKGQVQDLRELSFGGGIKYTIAHYLTPNGNVIDENGVTPDIEIQASAMEATGIAGSDPQLDEAIEVIKADM